MLNYAPLIHSHRQLSLGSRLPLMARRGFATPPPSTNPAATNWRIWFGAKHPHKWTLAVLGLSALGVFVLSNRYEKVKLSLETSAASETTEKD